MQPKSSPKAPSAKTHRRSRTGCFTCRLRRKKCDEGKPTCKACKNLGLQCEYKRPTWWSNVDHRKRHKENIKLMIKKTKLNEKMHSAPSPMHRMDSPPALTHITSPSDTSDATFVGNMDRRRSSSADSGYSLVDIVDQEGYGRYHQVDVEGYQVHNAFVPEAGFPAFAPYDAALNEKQIPMHGISFRRDSIQPKRPSINAPLLTPPSEPAYDAAELPLMIPNEEFTFFDFNSYPTPADSFVTYVPVEEEDQPLLDHFLANVLPILFPILDMNIRTNIILPALSRNKCFLHCCLSIAALHKKATENIPAEQIDSDIMRHRFQTVYELQEALTRNTDHLDILEATLGVILFQTTVGIPDDSLPDIAWHQHFQAAIDLISRLGLKDHLTDLQSQNYSAAPFNMNLAAWIDILGSSMIGRTPEFADAYRDKLVMGGTSGLRELMGCDDRIMYLISETICLEALIIDGMLPDPTVIVEHVNNLLAKIDHTEANPMNGHTPVTIAITDAFRNAARIYLRSLVPGFNPADEEVRELLINLENCLRQFPAGAQGFDRSLVWVYLIAGSVATQGSSFRELFQSRKEDLAEDANMGSFGRMCMMLEAVWDRMDKTGGQPVHWRSVMRANGWDFLMI